MMRSFLNKAVAVIIMILVAGLVVFIIWHYAREYYKLGWSGYFSIVLNFLKQLGLMILFCCIIVILVGVIVILESFTGKIGRISIFISYQHDQQEVLNELKNTLDKKWFETRFIEYAPAEHDMIVQQVRQLIREADVVIVLPGAAKSFVDAEILAASVLTKPVIFIRMTEEQTTPDTGFKGYPIFDLPVLRKEAYHPLQQFLLYINRSPRDLRKNFLRTAAAFYNTIDSLHTDWLLGLTTIAIIILDIVSFSRGLEFQLRTYPYLYWAIIFIAVSVFAYKYITVFLARSRAIKIARQQIITGDYTFDFFSGIFNDLKSDRRMTNAMVEGSLPLRH